MPRRFLNNRADLGWLRDELAFAWRSAQDDAVAAYKVWCELGGATEYAAYRAAQDRADQAQDVLAAESRVHRGAVAQN
jgi:hypothetical protein